jgi:hypothetical protein
MIEVYNEEVGLFEKFEQRSLDFIRRSYDQFKDIPKMSEDDYKKLAMIMVLTKYRDTRFDNLEWKVRVE